MLGIDKLILIKARKKFNTIFHLKRRTLINNNKIIYMNSLELYCIYIDLSIIKCYNINTKRDFSYAL